MDLVIVLDLLLYSLFLLYKGLVDNTYPKEYKMIQSKDSVVIEPKVTFYATEKLVLTF